MHHAGHGSPRRPNPRRLLPAVGGTLIALTALLTALPGPADAATVSGGRLVHPERDWMGSTLAAHEGRAVHPERDWMGSTVAAHEGRAVRGGSRVSSGVPRTPGFDVSNWQGTVNWAAAYDKGAKFAYIKATEGTTYKDPKFNANYVNSYNEGFIRGAYHFAVPNSSSGKAQADYFVSHGGGWSKDGKTLPPMLDIEYGTTSTCWGLSQASMRTWISAFLNEVHAKTSRWASIYTSTGWWTTCTGNTSAYAAKNPLFIARYASTVGTLPAGWPFYTFWQHADSGTFPGDQDYFNGPYSGVQNLANNT